MLNARHFLPARPGKIMVMLGALIALLWLSGCENLEEQPKLDEPYADSELFNSAARDLEPGVVPVGHLNEDAHFYEGTVDGEPAEAVPFELTAEILAEGQRTYNDFCTPCHGYDGYGEGVIALEGHPEPATFHTDRLREAPVGYVFQVITNGFGNMFSYASRIQPEDRWAVAAYVKALQMSQYTAFEDLPPEIQAEFDTSEIEGQASNGNVSR